MLHNDQLHSRYEKSRLPAHFEWFKNNNEGLEWKPVTFGLEFGGKVSLSIHIFPGQQLLPYSCSLPPLMSSAVLIFSFSAIANCRAVRPSRVGHWLEDFLSCVAFQS